MKLHRHLAPTGETAKLRAGIALTGRPCALCFVKNARFCCSLNQQRRLKEKEPPRRRSYGSTVVHHRVYVTSYFHTLRKSTDAASARVAEHEFIFQSLTADFIAS